MHLYLFTQPTRYLVLATPSHCLVFRQQPNTTNGDGRQSKNPNEASVVVEFVRSQQVDLNTGIRLTQNKVAGTLGLVEIRGDVFLSVITGYAPLGSLTPSSQFTRHGTDTNQSEPISRILSVHFYCLTTSNYDSFATEPSDPNSPYYQQYLESSSEKDLELSAVGSVGNGIAGFQGGGPGQGGLQGSGGGIEHPCSGMRKILSNGQFYFSTLVGSDPAGGVRSGTGDLANGWDISSRLERRVERELRLSALARSSSDGVGKEKEEEEEKREKESFYDERFLWNSWLVKPLLKFRSGLTEEERKEFDACGFLVLAIQGFAQVFDLTMPILSTTSPAPSPTSPYIPGSHNFATVTLSLISRLGWKRAGTRYNTRGVDDDGNVANFVETETIFRTKDMCFSFVQIRGSVPLFWEQQASLQPFSSAKVTITRPQLASQPAFERHFADLLTEYPRIHIVNLLSTRDHEALLSTSYADHLRAASTSDIAGNVQLSQFDFHAKARVGGIESVRDQLKKEQKIDDAAERFGYTLVGLGGSGERWLISRQEGVFRTNCLDTLDRTNFVQDILSRLALEHYLVNSSPSWAMSDAMWGAHRTLWAENGDALSRIYAGTGALKTSFTRSGKQTLAGVLSDATKSVGRMYVGNFLDKGKQQAIDALLGHLAGQQKIVVFDPIHDSVKSALASKQSEYSSVRPITVYAGTYNLNGKPPASESLLPWLCPPSSQEPDIFAVGFQEIVQLSPQQIMATDPEKKRRWEAHITQTLSSRPNKKSDYIILRSEQLVGAALIILIKTSLATEIRNVEGATKKTGLKGMAGNKGGAAIRLDLHDTSFCFVTAHFAAGSSNVEERNADFWTITNELTFQRGRRIDQHDNVVWLGDFNYRVSLPNEQARPLALKGDVGPLLEKDQLNMSRKLNLVFPGYEEGAITFKPTYKYDNGTDVYDSSEKQRVPSWTDRIIFKGKDLELNWYRRAELMVSDHRPVYALFGAKVRIVDYNRKSSLSRQLVKQLRAASGDDRSSTRSRTDSLASSRRSSVSSLPNPSDEAQTWWSEPGNADGTYEPDPALLSRRNPNASNPFAEDFIMSKTSIQTDPRSDPGTAKRKPPPPPRPRPQQPDTVTLPDPSTPATVKSTSPPLPPKPSLAPPRGRPSLTRQSSNASLIDSDDGGSASNAGPPWKAIEPTKAPAG